LKILIAGASGMLGSAIVRRLSKTDHILYTPSSGQMDLMDNDSTYRAFNEIRPDYVIFCAGKVGGLYDNMVKHNEYFEKNLTMGLIFFKVANDFRVSSGVNFSSSCVYSPSLPLPFKENDYFRGEENESNAGYAKAKRFVALHLLNYNSNHGRKYITLVPPNLYGINDNYNLKTGHMIASAIAKVVNSARTGESITIKGSGLAKREIMSVDKLADIVSILVENHDMVPQILNVGTGESISVLSIYEKVAKLCGVTPIFNFTDDTDDILDKKMDISLLKNILDEIELRKAIDDYVSKEAIF
jgi:GDP-L-fucose synthase